MNVRGLLRVLAVVRKLSRGPILRMLEGFFGSVGSMAIHPMQPDLGDNYVPNSDRAWAWGAVGDHL